MGKLYSTADHVFAWLGSSPFRNSEAVTGRLRHWIVGLRDNRPFSALYLSSPPWTPRAIIRKTTYAIGRVSPSKRLRLVMVAREFNVLEGLKESLEAFDRTVYWSRMWILQEFILATRPPTLLLGSKLELDDDFMQAAVWARSSDGLFHCIAEKMAKATETHVLDLEEMEETRRDMQQIENGKMLMKDFGFVKHISARETYKGKGTGWLLSSLLRDTYAVQAGNVRDKVYALYSMAPGHYGLPMPDYSAPADKVLRDVVARVIEVEKNVRIYDWLSPSPPDSPYPSWTLEFEDSIEHEQYNSMRRINFALSDTQASRGGESTRDPSVCDESMVLRLFGWQVEDIAVVFDLPKDHGVELRLRAAWRCVTKADALVQAHPSAQELKSKPSKLTDYLRLLKEVTKLLDPNRDPDLVVTDLVGESDKQENLIRLMMGVTREANEDLRKKVDDLRYQDDDLEGSTLFCTAGGYVGFVYNQHMIQPGDKVVILQGCEYPHILREKDDRWAMIGSAYVSGIMDGEYLDLLRRTHGVIEAEAFDIM
jgi:hypothetical protein